MAQSMEEHEIEEMIKTVKRDGGQLSLAYRPFRRIPGSFFKFLVLT